MDRVNENERDCGREPPAEASGRVSNPERYRVLHQWGEELLDRLTAQFDVCA